MGIFGRGEPAGGISLEKDIIAPANAMAKTMRRGRYQVDCTLEGMGELDRYMTERCDPSLPRDWSEILYGIGAFVGLTVLELYGGRWALEECEGPWDPTLHIVLDNGKTVYPILRVVRRFRHGSRAGIREFVANLELEEEPMPTLPEPEPEPEPEPLPEPTPEPTPVPLSPPSSPPAPTPKPTPKPPQEPVSAPKDPLYNFMKNLMDAGDAPPPKPAPPPAPKPQPKPVSKPTPPPQTPTSPPQDPFFRFLSSLMDEDN